MGSGASRVITTVTDNSQIPSTAGTSEVKAGMVVNTNWGSVGKAVYCAGVSDFIRKFYLGSTFSDSVDSTMYLARRFLDKSGQGLWVVRPDNNSLHAGALVGSELGDGNVQTMETGVKDVSSYVFESDQPLAVFMKYPSSMGNEFGFRVLTYREKETIESKGVEPDLSGDLDFPVEVVNPVLDISDITPLDVLPVIQVFDGVSKLASSSDIELPSISLYDSDLVGDVGSALSVDSIDGNGVISGMIRAISSSEAIESAVVTLKIGDTTIYSGVHTFVDGVPVQSIEVNYEKIGGGSISGSLTLSGSTLTAEGVSLGYVRKIKAPDTEGIPEAPAGSSDVFVKGLLQSGVKKDVVMVSSSGYVNLRLDLLGLGANSAGAKRVVVKLDEVVLLDKEITFDDPADGKWVTNTYVTVSNLDISSFEVSGSGYKAGLVLEADGVIAVDCHLYVNAISKPKPEIPEVEVPDGSVQVFKDDLVGGETNSVVLDSDTGFLGLDLNLGVISFTEGFNASKLVEVKLGDVTIFSKDLLLGSGEYLAGFNVKCKLPLDSLGDLSQGVTLGMTSGVLAEKVSLVVTYVGEAYDVDFDLPEGMPDDVVDCFSGEMYSHDKYELMSDVDGWGDLYFTLNNLSAMLDGEHQVSVYLGGKEIYTGTLNFEFGTFEGGITGVVRGVDMNMLSDSNLQFISDGVYLHDFSLYYNRLADSIIRRIPVVQNFVKGEAVRFRSLNESSSVPKPLVENTAYYVVDKTDDGILVAKSYYVAVSDEPVFINLDDNGVGSYMCVPVDTTVTDPDTFAIQVYRNGVAVSDEKPIVMSLNSDKRDGFGLPLFVEQASERSLYLNVIKNPLVDSNVKVEAVAITTAFGGGSDGDVVDESMMVNSLNALSDADRVDLKLLLDSGWTTVGYQGAVVDLAIKRGDCQAILSSRLQDELMPNNPEESIVSYVQDELNVGSRFASIFTPHLKVSSDTGRVIYISPVADCAAVLAKNMIPNAWEPAAGVTKGLLPTDVLGLAVDFIWDEATGGTFSTLANAHINYIRNQFGVGKYINEQYTQNPVNSFLSMQGNQMAVISVLPKVRLYLEGYRHRIINGSGAGGDLISEIKSGLVALFGDYVARNWLVSYEVIMDDSNNTDLTLDNQELYVSVRVLPTSTSNWIYFDLSINSNTVSATVSA